jgi:hypothetical protein
MAQASKMGADAATREARRSTATGFQCMKCGRPITVGELLMVQSLALDERGRGRKVKNPYHRSCY